MDRIVDLARLVPDLALPSVHDGAPAAGRRVRATVAGADRAGPYHMLWLPPRWRPDRRWPLLVEYPGNGPHRSDHGDVSSGRQEDACLGYGIDPVEAVWAVLPCADPRSRAHARWWWGDADATAAYARAAVADLIARFAVDPSRVVLCGFSRGAIACGYIGLRDDATASLWRGLIASSHYDGVRSWGHPDEDRASALARIARLAGRPQCICHEQPDGTAATRAFLAASPAAAATTAVDLPWPNHTDRWTLHDVPERARVRAWLARTLAGDRST